MSAFDPRALAARLWSLIEREDNGNVAAAARRCDVSVSALVELLAGDSGRPSAETLGAIIDAYRVAPLWLLLGEGEPPTETLAPSERLELLGLLGGLAARVFRRYRHAPSDDEGHMPLPGERSAPPESAARGR